MFIRYNLKQMTQEQANKIFKTELRLQLDVIYVTSANEEKGNGVLAHFSEQLPPKKIELSEQMKNWIRFTILVYSMPFGCNLR